MTPLASPTEPRRLLAIRLSSIGDVVLTTPALRAIRRRFPEAELDLVVRTDLVPLMATNPHVSRLIPLDPALGRAGRTALRADLLAGDYDLVIDWQDSLRSRALRRGVAPEIRVIDKRPWRRLALIHLKHDTYPSDPVPVPLRYIEPLAEWGVTDDGLGLELPIPVESRTRADQIWQAAGLSDRVRPVGLVPGARHETKRWPTDHAIALARARVASEPVVLFGGPDERALGAEIAGAAPGTVDLTGRLSLLEAAHLLGRCRAVVSNDTALMHLAAAAKTPVVALFGSTVPQFGFGPFGTRARIVQVEGLRCRPCTHIGRAECPLGHFRCMVDLTVASVQAALDSLELDSPEAV